MESAATETAAPIQPRTYQPMAAIKAIRFVPGTARAMVKQRSNCEGLNQPRWLSSRPSRMLVVLPLPKVEMPVRITIQQSVASERPLLAADEIVVAFPSADDTPLTSFNERFDCARTRVIVRRLHKSVRAGGEDGEELATLQSFHVPGARQKITRLTDGAHDIDRD